MNDIQISTKNQFQNEKMSQVYGGRLRVGGHFFAHARFFRSKVELGVNLMKWRCSSVYIFVLYLVLGPSEPSEYVFLESPLKVLQIWSRSIFRPRGSFPEGSGTIYTLGICFLESLLKVLQIWLRSIFRPRGSFPEPSGPSVYVSGFPLESTTIFFQKIL